MRRRGWHPAPRADGARLALWAAACASCVAACAPLSQPRVGTVEHRKDVTRAPNALPDTPPPESADPAAELFRWRADTRSPRPAGPPDPSDRGLLELCASGDASLNAVAARVAERQAAKLAPLDVAQITFALRAQGVPYVWPRIWSLEGVTVETRDARARLARWLGTFHDGGVRRCGIADVRASDGERVLAVVAVDVLADLAALPTRVRSGHWLEVRAKLLVPADAASVIVLGPRGAPKSVPTTLHHGLVEAAFSADRAGPWLVQVVASVQTGPRPVAEAMIQADAAQPARFHAEPAPGEDAARGAADDATRLERMVNAARVDEGLKPLARDPRLDGVARAHVRAMMQARELGHDVGDGSPADRVAALGLAVTSAGENVAHARTVRLAHRALWASPSHRDNLLHRGFDALGVGVARDRDGSVWVCELFAEMR
jgi:uncharacterized protein YkwD